MNPASKTKIVVYEVLAAAGVLASLLLLLFNWSSLPEILPTHFDFRGQPDAYGDKSMLLLLAGAGIFIYITVGLLSFFPNAINTPWKITEANREIQTRLALDMLRCLKVSCTWLFTYLIYGTIQIATGKAAALSPYLLPIILLGALLPSIIYFVKAYRAR